MAANRTFQFMGIAYGSTPVTLTAMINSNVVFSGEVPTVDAPTDSNPPPEVQGILFEIANSAVLNTDFAGSLPMTVNVSGGNACVMGEILCNYVDGTPTTYGQCYNGTPTNSEGTPDPRSSVYIDSWQQVPPNPPSLGCWTWCLNSSATLIYNFNISVGQVGNVVGNFANYVAPV